MKPSQRSLFLTFLLLTSSSLCGEAQCPGNAAPLRYHLLKPSMMAVSATINHAGPYEFIFDTGAQITMMEPSLAEELKLKPEGSVNVVTVSQITSSHYVIPDAIEAGGVTIHKPVVALIHLGQMQALNPKAHVRGILGQNFLGSFEVLLDNERKTICLDESRQMQNMLQGERVPMTVLRERGGSLLFPEPVFVAVHIFGDGKKNTILKVDSGANVAILFASRLDSPAWQQLAKASHGSTAGKARGDRYAVMPPLEVRIGKKTMRQIAFITPIGEGRPTRPGEDGLLPTALFKRVFISHADHFVMFDPR